ncbi:MAG TPA: hypothetical protein VE078_01100 [Thermoanaerobaculia bacterium]|nr:hypothetical protein [Thermoanaerobaculia bacterium]
MSLRRVGAGTLLSLALAASATGEEWGVGASFGLVNDVENRLRLEDFEASDAQAWVDYRLEDHVLLRATAGTMKTKGENAGLLLPDSDELLPDLDQRIDYVTIGVAYQFWEGNYTSALFGGIGGYKINPDPVDEEFRNFRDPHERVFGWHAGMEADLRVLARVSFVGRLTYHKVRSLFGRSLLTANAGAVYRF